MNNCLFSTLDSIFSESKQLKIFEKFTQIKISINDFLWYDFATYMLPIMSVLEFLAWCISLSSFIVFHQINF